VAPLIRSIREQQRLNGGNGEIWGFACRSFVLGSVKPKWCAQKGFIEKRGWVQLDRACARQQIEELEYWTMGTSVKKKIKPW
jgi:hypothetical protein